MKDEPSVHSPGSVYLIYLDDSRDERLGVLSALAIPADKWKEAFQSLRDFRRGIRRTDRIRVYKELHAWKFVSGRGRICEPGHFVPKGRRCQIFKDALALAAKLPGCRLFNATFPHGKDITALDRLLTRINNTMKAWGSHAILIIDSGKELEYTRLARRTHVFNPIPSQFGHWAETGGPYKNIPIERILEDPFFKDSRRSYFIQLADFCAYALLRRERPVDSKTKYGMDKAFDLLSAILVREATKRDPEGIIRVE